MNPFKTSLIRAIVSCTLMFGACSSFSAVRCSLSDAGSAAASKNGAALTLPLVLDDCLGVEVLRGRVVACVQDSRERLTCREMAATTAINASSLPNSGTGRGWLDVVMAVLRGDVARRDAVSRQIEIGDLPRGPVAFVGGPWVVRLGFGPFARVDRIDLTDAQSGERLATLASGETHSLEARELFRSGRVYAWTLRSSDSAIDDSSGKFTVISAAAFTALERELSQVPSATGIGKSARALMAASVLKEQGFDFDARQWLVREGQRP